MTGSAFKRWTLYFPLLLGEKSKGEEVRRRGGSKFDRVGALADDGKRCQAMYVVFSLLLGEKFSLERGRGSGEGGMRSSTGPFKK